MTDTNMESTKKHFLSFCADDWAGLWVLVKFINEDFPNLTEEEIRENTLNILRELFEDGLIQPGKPAANFIPWESRTAESIERIRDEWLKLGELPALGDIVWLNITQKGLDLVRSWEKRI